MSKLPLYNCHKKVRALKIESIEVDDNGSVIITPEYKSYLPFEVSQAYMEKHVPVSGGYYVVYEDGYESYSPAKAFEEGYTLDSKY